MTSWSFFSSLLARLAGAARMLAIAAAAVLGTLPAAGATPVWRRNFKIEPTDRTGNGERFGDVRLFA
jgi:hypothetical protein